MCFKKTIWLWYREEIADKENIHNSVVVNPQERGEIPNRAIKVGRKRMHGVQKHPWIKKSTRQSPEECFLFSAAKRFRKRWKRQQGPLSCHAYIESLMTAAQCPLLDESARHHESVRQKVKCEDENKYSLTCKENVQLNSFCIRVYYEP